MLSGNLGLNPLSRPLHGHGPRFPAGRQHSLACIWIDSQTRESSSDTRRLNVDDETGLSLDSICGRALHLDACYLWPSLSSGVLIDGLHALSSSSRSHQSSKEIKKRNVHGRLNASWKICSLAVNGQSFLVIFGYLLNSLSHHD